MKVIELKNAKFLNRSVSKQFTQIMKSKYLERNDRKVAKDKCSKTWRSSYLYVCIYIRNINGKNDTKNFETVNTLHL